MVVASANNAAVENISQQLPALAGVAAPFREDLRYFRDAANAVVPLPKQSGADEAADDAADGVDASDGGKRRTHARLLRDGAEAWGFGAATLGSRSRVDNFAAVVGRYLPAGQPGDHLLAVLERSDASDWFPARCAFAHAQAAVEHRVATLARVHAEQVFAECQRSAAAAVAARERHAFSRPGFWARLKRTEAHRHWRELNEKLRQAENATAAHARAAAEALRDCEISETSARLHVDRTGHLISANRSMAEAEAGVSPVPPNVVDHAWFARDRNARELGTAWIDDELEAHRESLFVAAMRVHEAFARAAHVELAAALRTWLMLQSDEIEQAQRQSVVTAAWRALFLLTPLVSTTFASMARLMRDVDAESLGVLIVDEAGQAPAHAAVGGMQRFRRAFIVGDPLQLEPVVTLPRALIEEIMGHHGAPFDLAPHRASVQTVADSTAQWGTLRRDSWIGLPLTVHNRCLRPMFDISNGMAYGDMVQGRPDAPGTYDEILGPSRWIDVPRPDGSHFHKSDWEELRNLLHRFDWTALPSLAIITPFKLVKRELEHRVEGEIRRLLPSTCGPTR
jgi:hypothetical protein